MQNVTRNPLFDALALTTILLATALAGCGSTPPSAGDGGSLDDGGPVPPRSDAGTPPPPDGGGDTDAGPVACSDDADCDDANACNGLERCVAGSCAGGDAVTCTPSFPCQSSTCDPVTGLCVERLIDEDGDGAAPASLGTCGTDCDDTDAEIGPAAAEQPGDGVDQDCDGRETCYRDDDQDGFRQIATVYSDDFECTTTNGEAGPGQPVDCFDADASVRPGGVEVAGDEVDSDCDGTELCFADADVDGFRSESPVASSDVSCRAPGEALALAPLDCCDADARVFPGQGGAFTASLGASARGGWDFDCSGTEDRLYTTLSSCTISSGSVPMCIFNRMGWQTTVPPCGGSAPWVINCSGAGSCTRTTEVLEQECR